MATREWVCTACGTAGPGKKRTPGSFLIELFLWLAGLALTFSLSWIILLLPAAYTGYRITQRNTVCGSCGGATLIPADSPMGQQLLERMRDSRST